MTGTVKGTDMVMAMDMVTEKRKSMDMGTDIKRKRNMIMDTLMNMNIHTVIKKVTIIPNTKPNKTTINITKKLITVAKI